jgi:YidC/Oxa1 family membrane protein insertase
MSQTLRTRLFLIFTIVLLALLLWTKWQQAVLPKPAAPIQAPSKVLTSTQTIPGDSVRYQDAPVPSLNASTESVPLSNNLLALTVSLNDGNIVSASLLDYPETLGSQTPVELLYQSDSGQYVAETGLIGLSGLHYRLVNQSRDAGASATLQAEKNGVVVLKTYRLKPNSYEVSVTYDIKNSASTPWKGQLYGQLIRTPPDKHASLYSQLATFNGAAISNQEAHYQSFSFSKMSKSPFASNGTGGWVAMVQHYFVSAWIPDDSTQNHFYAKDYGDKNYGTGVLSPELTVNPGESKHIGGHFYIGPTLTQPLNAAAPFLSLTIDYGWLWFIAKYLFVVLSFIHGLVGNWGWSIVIITFLIKLVFFPLSHKSYTSMARMRLIQPKVKELQEQYAGNRPALQKAMMDLYAKEKVNPLGGCLPILIQIPIFIALYWMLMASVELRQAPFLGWLKDLSVHDPYYILPLLTGALMLLQQILGPKPPDKTQMYVMMSMPLIFMIFMFNVPSGLGLYMVINIGVSIAQQALIIRMTQRAPSSKTRRLKSVK